MKSITIIRAICIVIMFSCMIALIMNEITSSISQRKIQEMNQCNLNANECSSEEFVKMHDDYNEWRESSYQTFGWRLVSQLGEKK